MSISKFLKIGNTFIVVCLFAAAAISQEIYTPLATMDGRSFTVQDLPAELGNAWLKLPETLAKARKDLLELQIDDLALRQEAYKRSIDLQTLFKTDVYKNVPDPSDQEIKKFYDDNKNRDSPPLADIRANLIKYLRIEPEKKALTAYIASLRATAKVEYIKDVNSERFVPRDVIATVNAEPITHALYIKKNGLASYEYEANVFDSVNKKLREIVDAAVYQTEAQNLEIPVNELIRREVTSQMKEFSVTLLQMLEASLKSRLYEKYRVKFFITEPKPFVQNVSADDDPFTGKADAKVTVIVFADFECPGCAAVHPIIKSLAAKYGDNVRLVYRDFPLERIHDFAFGAALAANAARKQGKFFEYADLLYRNQDALDQASLVGYAQELGLDVSKFSADIIDPANALEIRKDMVDGEEYGVASTPSIFVNGYRVRDLSVPAFEDAIKRALEGKFE